GHVRTTRPRVRLLHIWHALVPEFRDPRGRRATGRPGPGVGARTWSRTVRRSRPRHARPAHRPRLERGSSPTARPLYGRRRSAPAPNLCYAAGWGPGHRSLGEEAPPLRRGLPLPIAASPEETAPGALASPSRPGPVRRRRR